jgi:hypothetical protein
MSNNTKLAILNIYGTEQWYVEPYSEQKELFRGTYKECLCFIEENETFNTKEI